MVQNILAISSIVYVPMVCVMCLWSGMCVSCLGQVWQNVFQNLLGLQIRLQSFALPHDCLSGWAVKAICMFNHISPFTMKTGFWPYHTVWPFQQSSLFEEYWEYTTDMKPSITLLLHSEVDLCAMGEQTLTVRLSLRSCMMRVLSL